MARAGTATINIQADTEEFMKQMGAVEESLNGLPSRVLMDYCRLEPWTLIRMGWWLAVGASGYVGFLCAVFVLLARIFDWH